MIRDVGGGDVVVPRVGRLLLSGVRHQAREVFPAQKAKDAVDLAVVITPTEFNPTPAQVININY